MTLAPPARQARPQTVLEVVRTERLTPHLVRVFAGGPGLASFSPNDFTDAYVKIAFPRPDASPDDRPVTRTYTVRRLDAAAGELAIDFVVHGDEGIAGPWAAAAQPGDRLTFSGPGGGYTPDPAADWHLLLGDESATPAVAAALEAMPADAAGIALLECDGPDDELSLVAPQGFEVRWVHRGVASAGVTTLLADAVAALAWREGRVQVFAHGERESMKALRGELLTRRGVPRADLSLSGYWARGRTEDRFQAEKREPIGQIL